MVERLTTVRKIPPYESLAFSRLTPEIMKRAETIKKGLFKDIIPKLRASILDPEEHPYISAVLGSEIAKATINEKIDQNTNSINGIRAMFMCIDLQTAIYYGNQETCLRMLKNYEKFIKSSELKGVFDRSIEEFPDFGITSESARDEDFKNAQDLLKETKGDPILAIIICHRGFRRGLDVFLEYKYISNTPTSIAYVGRNSPGAENHDRGMKYSSSEVQLLRRLMRGRKTVIISPTDTFLFRKQDGQINRSNRLRLSVAYHSRLTLGTEGNPAEIISVPIPLVEKNN